MTEDTIQEQIRRALRNLTRATIVIYIALAGLGLFAYIDSNNRRAEIEQVAVNSNNALCALRADLERRVETSEEFLRENPNGIPGLPAAAIQQSIVNQRQTIDALANLDCSTEGGTP